MACGWAPTWLSEFSATISAILAILAITGNLLVCIAVYKDPHKNLRTSYMFILVNLAVTDLVVGCITLPIAVVTHALEALGTKKEIHVTISRMLLFVSCTASVLNLTMMCIDRYISVNYPFKHQRFCTPRWCLIICSTIWCLAIGVCLIYFITDFMNFLMIFAQISILIVVVISSITFCLLKRLVSYSKEHREITYNNNKATRKSDKRVIITFMTILGMFFLCYTPAIVFMYTLKFCTNCPCTVRHVLRDLNFLFIASNSAVNPFVCTIRLKPFREALRTIFAGNKDSVLKLPVLSSWKQKQELSVNNNHNGSFQNGRNSVTMDTFANSEEKQLVRESKH